MVEKKIARTVFDTQYETVDGKIFENKNDAVRHEVELATKLDPQLLAIVLSQRCDHLQETSDCSECPFFDGDECILRVFEPWVWNKRIS